MNGKRGNPNWFSREEGLMAGEIGLDEKTRSRIVLVAKVDKAIHNRDKSALKKLAVECADIDILTRKIKEALDE